ncbi:hypothetical protein K431DRAFT_217879 [Polychaeton citri CBS 116435]|uniref:RBR-type E3 ubiquitin transferase n=1 Tax=Polychaeton citri CBS 116435 TaxID=1314669 RepID=A0A9P4QC79_9PEZI|nr:hypothetical protein K431DRAFT_217879 [Polychaeton citri CBS 116435]
MASPRLRECVVCGDEKEPLEFLKTPVTSRCDHTCNVCNECLHSWLATEFDVKGTEGIKCPECPQVLQYHEVQRAASSKTFETYDRITTRNALASLPNFAWCLGPNCDSGQLNIENHNFMECIHCRYKQCIKHSCAWHQDEDCTQYEYRTSGRKARDEEAASVKVINEVSKLCPGKGCGWRIQKIDGCDHMTCRRCRHEFCWQCMAPQSEIKRVGNTAHKEDCKFHSHNLDLAWPFNVHAGVNRAVEA